MTYEQASRSGGIESSSFGWYNWGGFERKHDILEGREVKKKIIIAVVFICAIGISFYIGCRMGYNFGEALYNTNIRIGKSLSIDVPSNIAVNADYIESVCDGELNYKGVEKYPEPFLDLCDRKEIDRLIRYMSHMNYKIAPGKYELSTADYAEIIIATLKFEPDI
ncbi:MAG: hypothetical protein LBU86_02720 [Oscillospiraceae bacterium]|nr:hypothetical protein [Oscillospiraceae bacterium]